MNLLWLSDIHLDHLALQGVESFLDRVGQEVTGSKVEAIFVSGDIATSDGVADSQTSLLQTVLRRLASLAPTYFVLGNHDFWSRPTTTDGPSMAEVRKIVAEEAAVSKGRLTYLTALDRPWELQPGYFVAGVDGWGDSRYGDIWVSHQGALRVADQNMVRDFRDASLEQPPRPDGPMVEALVRLGRESGMKLFRQLSKVPEDACGILVVTHVPPWPVPTCGYGDRRVVRGLDYGPHYACRGTGEILEQWQARSGLRTLVLAGHVHVEDSREIQPGLRMMVNEAIYGAPGWILISTKDYWGRWY